MTPSLPYSFAKRHGVIAQRDSAAHTAPEAQKLLLLHRPGLGPQLAQRGEPPRQAPWSPRPGERLPAPPQPGLSPKRQPQPREQRQPEQCQMEPVDSVTRWPAARCRSNRRGRSP